MSYEEALFKIENSHRFGPNPGLSRMKELLAKLGNPQEQLKFVHVAGTNGKGTTCTLAASVLRSAGYRTGLYISPHVSDFRERMQIDGEMIPRAEMVSAANRVFPAAEEIKAEGGSVTEFELITAIALLWFAERKCDVVVLEVGLGGRLDATNVISRPLVSVITSLSMDHTEILGDTIEKIAAEKCGIIKEGGVTVCTAVQLSGALEVIRKIAGERQNRLVEASLQNLKILSMELSGTELLYRGNRLRLPFLGEHQVENAATALAALEVLREEGWNIPAAALAEGFAAAKFPARLEVLSQNPLVLLDGAHNPGGTDSLAKAVRRYLGGREIVALMGMLADKDAEAALKSLAGLFSAVVTTVPNSPRAMSAEALAQIWNRLCTPAEPVPDADSALSRALSKLKPDGALVICGSLYLAGDLRQKALELFNR